MGDAGIRGGSLTKRHTTNGWRWCGQIRRKDSDGRWRTILKALTDENGAPIMTDADIVDEDGNRTRTTRNIRKANKALEAWRTELEGAPAGGRLPVADYIRAELDAREGTVHKSTMRKYREYVPIIERGMEGLAMRDLDAAAVKAWVSVMKARGLKPSTIATAYALLRDMCESAVEAGNLSSNPCTGRLRRQYVPKQSTSDPNALDDVGVRRANALLDATTNDRLRVGARLALACGLRCGEVCGLRWRDIDLDAMELHVRNAIGRGEGGTYVKPPKTEGSNRDLSLPESLAREISQWRDMQRPRWKALADGQQRDLPSFEDCYVVGWPDGRFMTPHALTNAWTRLARHGDADGELLGTEGRRVTFHDLRHTYATHLISMGVDAVTVARHMGHRDYTVTMRRYATALARVGHTSYERAIVALTSGTMWAEPAGEDAGTDER